MGHGRGIAGALRAAWRTVLAALVVLLTVALVGCGSPAAQDQPQHAGAMQQLRDGVRCDLVLLPAQPQAMHPFTMRLALQNGAGAPVTAVKVRLTMPGMQMARNEPALAQGTGGAFTGKALLTMSGRWQLDVTADPGGSHFRFPVICR
jgi:hypothetical protein